MLEALAAAALIAVGLYIHRLHTQLALTNLLIVSLAMVANGQAKATVLPDGSVQVTATGDR